MSKTEERESKKRETHKTYVTLGVDVSKLKKDDETVGKYKTKTTVF
ncbi:MAG: hypothetical protein WC601_02430 [Desulfotomaculaceae bacterium]